jgi:O-antigen ligase
LLLAQPVPPLLRVIRLALALAVPLLLWTRLGSDPVMFIRTHLLGYVLLALVVLAGLLLEPGTAWTTSASFGPPGRLQGVFLPMLPTRVGEIGAVIVGLAVIALAFRRTRIPVGAALIVIGLSLVVMSRTRTAAAALLIGLIVAFLLTSHSGRGLWGLIAIAGVIVTAAPFFKTVWTWALRQQSAQELSSVTGRTRAWTAIVQQEIPLQTVLLGHGLGNKNVMLRRGEGDFAAMAIDNSWLSLYWETGLMGTALVALALVATWVAVLRVPTPYVRAAASFLIVYVTISSVSETGLSDLSSLTLLMVVAGGAAYADRLRTGRHPPLPETHCSRAALAPVSE